MASVRPKPRASLTNAPGILYVCRSRLALVGTRVAVVVDQPFLQTSHVSPLILVLVRTTCLVRQQWLGYLLFPPIVVLAYPTVYASMRLRVLRYPIRLSATVSPAYRVGVWERRRDETSRHNEAGNAWQSSGWVGWTASWYHPRG